MYSSAGALILIRSEVVTKPSPANARRRPKHGAVKVLIRFTDELKSDREKRKKSVDKKKKKREIQSPSTWKEFLGQDAADCFKELKWAFCGGNVCEILHFLI